MERVAMLAVGLMAVAVVGLDCLMVVLTGLEAFR